LLNKLRITGEDHIFIGFNPKHSKDSIGNLVNSIDPTGISGGTLVDLGNLADPKNLGPENECRPHLVGLLIEKYPGYLVSTKIEVVIRASRSKGWI
jgi:hypothetical protein